jgi:phage terminase small subunit
VKPVVTTLTRKQALLVSALLTAPTLTAAAKAAGVSDVTAWRWLKLPEVEAAYREARRAVVHQAMTRLQQVCGTAVETLEEIMGDAEAPTSSRVTAARCALDLAVKAVELEGLEARITALEQRLKEK